MSQLRQMKATIFAVLSTVLCFVATANAQQADCVLSFAVDPSASTFNITGNITQPLQAVLTPGAPGVLIGLQGELTATLPGACPTNGAALAAALSSAQLSTTTATGPLQLYPANVTFKSGDLASLTWVDYAFNASVQLAAQGSPSQLQLTIAEGYTLSVSLITPQGERVDTTGLSGTGSAPATVEADGAGVTITVSAVALDIYAPYVSLFNGQEIQGAVNYTLRGDLVLRGATGCPSDCGANGRCAALPDGDGAACLCECGWGGAACDIPSGFCPKYTNEEAVAATICPTVLPPPAASSNSSNNAPCPAGNTTPNGSNSIAGAQSCSKWQIWDSETGKCRCPAGWEGPACDACTTDAACTSTMSSFFGREVTSTCNTNSRPYTTETAYKAYSCDLVGTGLESTIIPGTFAVGCNTTIGVLDAGNGSGEEETTANSLQGGNVSLEEGAYCDVRFEMLSDPGNLVSCKASLCSFKVGESAVSCRTTSCKCASDCPELRGILDEIEGQPAQVDCDEAGICVFDIKDFFVKLTAPCTNPECRVQGYELQESDFYRDASTNWDPLIAALPLIALLAAAMILSTYLLSHKRLFAHAAGRVSSKDRHVERLRPTHPASELSFVDLCAEVPTRNGPKLLLNTVSGVARMGELVGILGPSGSGKTSLLSTLAGAAEDIGRNVTVRGAITLDGAPMSAAAARRVAYCAQDLTLLPTLTVEECVRYSALLRLPAETPASEIKAVIERVIVELGLGGVASSLVGGGSDIRGVSGGERRRVTIAMELVTNPAAILLDEPTSGLDSSTAYQLMTMLKSVAASGRIVLLTFHQPSPAMFSLLDRALLMAKGNCLFSGPPAAVEGHFARLGLPCPAGAGAAEHMLHCATDDTSLAVLLDAASKTSAAVVAAVGGGGGDDETKTVSSYNDTTNTIKDLVKDNSGGEDAENGQTMPVASTTTTGNTNSREVGVGRELAVMFWRTGVDIIRNPTLLALHWGMSLLMGIFVGCIFWQVGNDISGAQNRAGGVFFALAFFAFTSLTTVDLLMGERRLVGREVRGGYYRPASYLTAKAVLDGLLLRAIPAFLYSAAFYPMMGLQGGAVHVLLFLCTLATFALAIGALSLAVTVGSTTAGQASLCMNLILLISLLMGGFFVNASSIPAWIRWLRYLSPFYFGYSALLSNEMTTLLLNFVVRGYAAVQNVRGSTFLEIIGVNMNVTISVLILDAMYVVFLIAAFALLYIRAPRGAWLSKSR